MYLAMLMNLNYDVIVNNLYTTNKSKKYKKTKKKKNLGFKISLNDKTYFI